MFWRDLKRKKRCRAMHWEVVPDRYGSGIPDRLLLINNATSLIELKWVSDFHEGKFIRTLTGAQVLWLERWQQKGGRCGILVGAPKQKIYLIRKNFFQLFQQGVSFENNQVISGSLDDAEKILTEQYGQ